MGTNIAEPLLTDHEVARRGLAHIDAGTTDEGEAWREPVEHYLDPDRFQAELTLLRSLPSVLAPVAAVPGPGDHITRTVAGVGRFAVRDREGRARVFRNACRHRGVPLVDGSGCARSLVCGYHGWTYELDGSLANIPHQDAFPDVDVHDHGLVDVDCRDVDGPIVIAGGDGRESDFEPLIGGRPWRDIVPTADHALVSSQPKPINSKVAGGLEDDPMSRGVQAGFASSANQVLEFGRHESAIDHFHRNLTTLFDEAPTR